MIVLAQNSLKYFEKVEGGWFLPEENEDDLINFINSLNNQIVDLQDALKEERKTSDELLEVKNKKIDNLEQQIEKLQDIRDELQHIISNNNEILNLNEDQKDLLQQAIEKFYSIENINNQIEKSYEEQLNLKDERIQLEVRKRQQDVIKYSIYALIIGAIGGYIVAQ